MLKLFILGCAAFALFGCANLTSQERQDLAAAAIGEFEYRIDQLQAIDLATIEVDSSVLIAADAACSFISIGSPYLVKAINNKIAKLNEGREEDAQTELVTVAEFQADLHAICGAIRKILVPKTDDEPEPTATS